MALISVVTPCYNEESNVLELYEQVKKVFKDLPAYQYEHIFIDNDSTDKTVEILKQISSQDKNVKLIVNARNFGHIRSPYYAILQANGDAVISLVADLQDPPHLIKNFLEKWEAGYKIVVGVKPVSHESKIMFAIRKLYYHFVTHISDVNLVKNFTGFGLYDKDVIKILRQFDEPYPYFRGLISETGYEIMTIPYIQPARKRGITKNNFYTLYDMAMLGITNHSKVPLRLATMGGFSLAIVSFLISFIYLLLKLIFWNEFKAGIAPLLIGVFFLFSIQLFFVGLLGEYLLSIQTRILKRPLVLEKERINF